MKYFITTFRRLWRNKLFSTLNILGLAISISACWIIYRIVNYEYSYEKDLPNRNNIYRLISGSLSGEKKDVFAGVEKPVYQTVREQIGSSDYAVPVFGKWMYSVEVNSINTKPVSFEDQTGVVATDSTYFSMLPYRWLAGNKSTALLAPESVVLTEDRAKQYFPGKKPQDIIHQTITYNSRDTVQRTVTGVVALNFNSPTEFTAQEFIPLPTKAYDESAWNNRNGSDKLYLQLKEGENTGEIMKQINNILLEKRKIIRQLPNDFKDNVRYKLLPLKEVHFATYVDDYSRDGLIHKADKRVLLGLMGVAMFLLLLACINYINLSVASIPQRTKEIAVKKTFGSSSVRLIGQFLSETLIIGFSAGIFSYVLSLFGFWLLKDIILPGVTVFGNLFQFIGFVVAITIVVAVLAGLYPAWLVTKVNAINVFRNTTLRLQRKAGFSLQKALIVFQFTIALIFIMSAIVIGKQLHYALNTDLGFNKDAVILAKVPWTYAHDKRYANKQFPLFTELKTIPGIQDVAFGSEPMTELHNKAGYEYAQENKEPIRSPVVKIQIDTAYFHVYGMKLLAGRNFYDSDTTSEIIINETASKAFGFNSPQDAIGKMIGQNSNDKWPVAGVVKDFYLQNFYTTIDPMIFENGKDNGGSFGTFNIKLGNDVSQWQKTIKAIEKKWNQFYPTGSFTFKFYDEIVEQMYQQELRLAKLVDLATAISIFISCLGLFGLAVLTTFQRTKEIGIRKVFGASVPAIVKLLSKEYVVLVIVAIVVSAPVAWWAMNKWLENFAYRISIEWWMFLLAGVIAVVIALATVSFQSIKAAMANPVKSLKTE